MSNLLFLVIVLVSWYLLKDDIYKIFIEEKVKTGKLSYVRG